MNKDFERALEIINPFVKKNAKVIEPKDLKVPLLFRIDQNVPTLYAPRMPKSHAPSENDNTPRVVTAPSLLGCVCGHAHIFWLTKTRTFNEDAENHFQIVSFEFEQALSVNEKLVYDAKETKEAWLITYNKDTLAYRPKVAGEVFVTKVSTEPRPNSKLNLEIAEVVVHVKEAKGVPLGANIVLEPGYYILKMDVTKYALSGGKGVPVRMSDEDDKAITVVKIDKPLFDDFKKLYTKKKR